MNPIIDNYFQLPSVLPNCTTTLSSSPDAFLISNGTDAFAVTGMSADLEFIGLEDNEKELVPEETEAVEDDDMDFAMF